MKLPRLLLCSLLLLGLTIGTVGAHTLGESYLFFTDEDGQLSGQLQVRSEDLGATRALAGQISASSGQADLDAAEAAVKAYFQAHVRLSADGRPLTMEYGDPVLRAVEGLGNYLFTNFSVPMDGEVPQKLELDYSLIMDDVPAHRALVVVRYSDKGGQTNFANGIAATFDTEQRSATVDLGETWPWKNFVNFVKSGTEHILFGLDHVLFVIALLVQAVVVRRDGRWVPVDNFRQGMIKLIKVVTLFTVAHSITLSLAVLGVVSLPSRLVESIIAASIAVVALNILVPIFKERIGWMVFIFGLFHGLGFAGNLDYLGLAAGSLAIPLAGFNVGVELGQLAIVVVLFPILYWLSRRDFYIPMVLKPGSGLIAVAALLWLTERMLDIDGLLPG